jgi:hypothetical protein
MGLRRKADKDNTHKKMIHYEQIDGEDLVVWESKSNIQQVTPENVNKLIGEVRQIKVMLLRYRAAHQKEENKVWLG